MALARWAARAVHEQRRHSVGMARDSKYFNLAEAPRPFFYLAFRQFYRATPELQLFIRTTMEPSRAIATLRRVVASVDPNAGAFHAVPLLSTRRLPCSLRRSRRVSWGLLD